MFIGYSLMFFIAGKKRKISLLGFIEYKSELCKEQVIHDFTCSFLLVDCLL